ncbi:MAG: hypothetical protein VZR00_02015 [Lachnospiraceae bacterium]|jgi:hypothetical protein|nr:hypothetical protein [Lachnospiraceae bacterium]MEE3460651.1 hypothetical protein [Lachnospiraceae bacterium]
MKNRILNYYDRIEKLLDKDSPDTDWEDLLAEHKTQIAFFQHERFVHLLVTVLFAILTFMSLIAFAALQQLAFGILCVPLFILLIPYIGHYYLLENTTQKMYIQYDRILAHIRADKQKDK